MNQKTLVPTDNYYSKLRQEGQNIYDLWEEGKAYQDSITPSIYIPQYRKFITSRIKSLVDYDYSKPILSVGSGNAFVERDLHSSGYSILASDPNPDAMEMAKQKGVPFVLADINQWEPEQKNWALIYCDGVMGHLYQPEVGFKRLLSRLRSWLLPNSGKILISNDAAVIDTPVHPHPHVQGFYWFSPQYLCSELSRAGFEEVESEIFIYPRPLTGNKERVIVQATVGIKN
ncbi:MAG: class I SAM-dependent methyltransferase [Moorea sp. SIO2I5]|nr:class I SAM-dependent methyltransferase [Moorena sp. SIO2I5]